MKQIIYYKSLGEDPTSGSPGTCTYNPKTNTRIACQTLKEILESESIIPNTLHSRFPRRLCVSRLDNRYKKVYRPSGIIFETSEKPGVCIPFDLMTLTTGKNLDSTDYNSETLLGYEKFIFRDYEEMVKEFRDPKQAIIALNQFRQEHGLPEIPESKLGYNEICFLGNEPVIMQPMALIGYSEEMQRLAEEKRIVLYKNIEEYQRSGGRF